jgi:hypothetical protein
MGVILVSGRDLGAPVAQVRRCSKAEWKSVDAFRIGQAERHLVNASGEDMRGVCSSFLKGNRD